MVISTRGDLSVRANPHFKGGPKNLDETMSLVQLGMGLVSEYFGHKQLGKVSWKKSHQPVSWSVFFMPIACFVIFCFVLNNIKYLCN